MKECKSCNKLLDMAAYSPDTRKEDGKVATCKKCTAARKRAKRHGIVCLYGWYDTVWECTKCASILELNIDNFYKLTSNNTKYDTMCRECRNTYHRSNKAKNVTVESKKAARVASNARYRKAKRTFIKYKGRECTQCHIKYDGTNSCIFDFHHVDPKTKEYEIGKRGLTLSNNLAELDKCVLLCANCHRKEHASKF